jgi:hypothetical protein
VYFLGVIDMLVPWSQWRKRAEFQLKRIVHAGQVPVLALLAVLATRHATRSGLLFKANTPPIQSCGAIRSLVID